MGAAARRRYAELFTADAMGAAYAALYSDLAQPRPRARFSTTYRPLPQRSAAPISSASIRRSET
jgi:hypothetical protein